VAVRDQFGDDYSQYRHYIEIERQWFRVAGDSDVPARGALKILHADAERLQVFGEVYTAAHAGAEQMVIYLCQDHDAARDGSITLVAARSIGVIQLLDKHSVNKLE